MWKLVDFNARYAQTLGQSIADAVELQRFLVRGDRARSGGFASYRTGPRGGVDANPFTVSLHLIASLAGGPRTSAHETAWSYWDLNFATSTRDLVTREKGSIASCSVTRQVLFGSAVEAILSDPDLAKRVEAIIVRRDFCHAEIHWQDRDRSIFVTLPDEHQIELHSIKGGLAVSASIQGEAILRIADDLVAYNRE